jgi:hypothetical protein
MRHDGLQCFDRLVVVFTVQKVKFVPRHELVEQTAGFWQLDFGCRSLTKRCLMQIVSERLKLTLQPHDITAAYGNIR